MAKYGAKSPLFAPFAGAEPEAAAPTYSPGFTVAKVVSCGVTPNYAEASLDADNKTSEYIKMISDEDIALETDTLILENAAKMFGAQIRGSDLVYTEKDNAPMGGFAFYHSEMRDNVVSHIGHFFPKVRASRNAQTFGTRGKAISFGTSSVAIKVTIPNCGDIEFESQPFANEADAYAWCASKVGIGKYFLVDVSAQGTTATKGVDKIGKSFLPSGETFSLAITGTPKVLYDNGVDSLTSIAAGVYKLTNVLADHSIAVIF
ncbi:MAG: hypothetical protein RSE64_08660 [Oscillospiraceae bacterium]